MDGSHVAVARKNNLSIFSPKFKEILQILLPIDKWTGDSDSIKGKDLILFIWAGPCSI